MKTEKIRQILQHSVFRYIVVGGLSLVVDYGLLLLLHHVLGVELWLATSVAFGAGLLVNFLLNKFWSFKSSGSANAKKSVRQASQYAALVVFNLFFTNLFIVNLNNLGIGPEITKPVATAMITLWNYALYKKVIFK